MTMLFALIPLAVLLLVVALWGFFWAVRSGQFDDLDTPAVRILLDGDDAAAADHADEIGAAAVNADD
jgi:cbb3-type cytochrome oxidase maturation protein